MQLLPCPVADKRRHFVHVPASSQHVALESSKMLAFGTSVGRPEAGSCEVLRRFCFEPHIGTVAGLPEAEQNHSCTFVTPRVIIEFVWLFA